MEGARAGSAGAREDAPGAGEMGAGADSPTAGAVRRVASEEKVAASEVPVDLAAPGVVAVDSAGRGATGAPAAVREVGEGVGS